MDQGKKVSVEVRKLEIVGPYTDILYDLIHSIQGVNMDATASAIYNILETILPGEYSTDYINDVLKKLVEELEMHIGG